MRDGSCRAWRTKVLTLGALVLGWSDGVANSPMPQPAIPADIRLTIGIKEPTLDEVLSVYQAFEHAAAYQAKLICAPTMKDYKSWRQNGFEPAMRTMVCSQSQAVVDSRSVLIDASWGITAPKSMTIDVRFGSQMEPSTKSRIERIIGKLEKSLKKDQAVVSLAQDTWSPQHLRAQIK
jgi:hypothetical protein